MNKGFIILVFILAFALVLSSIGVIAVNNRNDIFAYSNGILRLLDRVGSVGQSLIDLFTSNYDNLGLASDLDLGNYRRIQYYYYNHDQTRYYCAILYPKLFSGIERGYVCTDSSVGYFGGMSGSGLIWGFSSPSGESLYSASVTWIANPDFDFVDVFGDCYVYADS